MSKPPADSPTDARPAGALARLRAALYDILFPSRCVGCGRPGVVLCAACLQTIEFVPPGICERCGRPVPGAGPLCAACRRVQSPLERNCAVGYATGVLRKAIHRLKYGGQSQLAGPLAGLLRDWWADHGWPVDVVAPVPLHPYRRRQRGYNQAHLIGQAFSSMVGLSYMEDAISRTRDTRPQVGLKAAERERNVAGAFESCGDGVCGRRVLLIDDVMTTGATLRACAVALRAAGAAGVSALTVARARGDPRRRAGALDAGV